MAILVPDADFRDTLLVEIKRKVAKSEKLLKQFNSVGAAFKFVSAARPRVLLKQHQLSHLELHDLSQSSSALCWTQLRSSMALNPFL